MVFLEMHMVSSGVLKSIVNRIINTLRHTKKENIVGNVRETGNFGSSVRAPTVSNIQNLPKQIVK